MKKQYMSIALILVLLILLLSTAAFAEAAENPEGDEPPVSAESAAPSVPEADSETASPVTVSEGETFYAYEGMSVYNNGGTVFNNLATVYNNGGTVFNNGGTVFNNGGTVYANSGTVYLNEGTVYNHEAEVLSRDDAVSSGKSRILGYYELKLAGYYEPYVEMEGTTVEPGSEKMIITEDTVCRLTPRTGFMIAGARTDAGNLSFDGTDGSVTLTDVNEDTTLSLAILKVTVPAMDTVSGIGPSAAESVLVENIGSIPARVLSVELDSEDAEAFLLSYTGGRTIPAGRTDSSTWTVRPADNLDPGTYTGELVFILEGGYLGRYPLSFTIPEQQPAEA